MNIHNKLFIETVPCSHSHVVSMSIFIIFANNYIYSICSNELLNDFMSSYLKILNQQLKHN